MDTNAVNRVRCIILKGDGVWAIKRERVENGVKKLYYVLPGGGLEKGETPEQAAKREAMEELGVEIEILKEVYKYDHNNQINVCFLCKHISGKMGTGNGPEFNDESYKDRGSYTVMLLPISEAKKFNLVPIHIRDRLINDFNILAKKS